jgi:4-amino-4-deoxy-L-arabinose transferase-like glycosyltransferase
MMTLSLTQVQKGVLVAVIATLLALRIWFHLTASPLPDEAYYWLWGRNLDWSYFDHPPLQAWMQAISHWLFGTNLFVLRPPALVTSAIVFGCLIWWGQKFGAPRPYLLVSTAVILASPLMFLMMGMVFNDHLLIALLSLALIQLYLLFEGQMLR